MTSAAKLPPIDTSTRYMPLHDAVCLIGRRYPDWRDEDVDQLAYERENSADQEAWDRAAYTEEQLERWIIGKVLQAYDLNEYGAHRPVEDRWLETPYFTICARTSRFLVFPDEWASLTVDGPKLQEKLSGIAPMTPRKRRTFEWRPIVNRAWEIALEMELPRTQAALTIQLDQWFIDLSEDGKSGLGEKEMKQLAGDILRFLGNRRLSGDISPRVNAPADDPSMI